LTWLLSIAVAGAFALWAVAVWRAIRFLQAVPQGRRFGAVFPGWPWNVEKAVARYGPQVEAPLRAFQRTFLLFFILVFVVAIAAIFLAAASTPR